MFMQGGEKEAKRASELAEASELSKSSHKGTSRRNSGKRSEERGMGRERLLNDSSGSDSPGSSVDSSFSNHEGRQKEFSDKYAAWYAVDDAQRAVYKLRSCQSKLVQRFGSTDKAYLK